MLIFYRYLYHNRGVLMSKHVSILFALVVLLAGSLVFAAGENESSAGTDGIKAGFVYVGPIGD